VIYSVFGNQYLNHSEAIRIFFTGENVHPDFNLCDYAFGYDWLCFGDRYYRCPNYALYDEYQAICTTRRSSVEPAQCASSKRLFCNFVYSNRNAHPFREHLFHALSAYRRVDSPGGHLHNLDCDIGSLTSPDWTTRKVTLQRGYKFTIACENSSSPGYTTEKLVHALAADTVPIYFGNPLIGKEFNTKRFINCHEFDSVDAVVERVKELDQRQDLYLKMLAEPFFVNDRVSASLTPRAICRKFRAIFAQPKDDARRRNRYAWGRIYESRRRQEVASAR
jgi:hypothetical protein